MEKMPISGDLNDGSSTVQRNSNFWVRLAPYITCASTNHVLKETYNISFGTGARSCPGKCKCPTLLFLQAETGSGIADA